MGGKKGGKKGKKKGLTPAQARKLLMKEVQARVTRCRMKIDKILEDENCILDCSIIVTGRGNIPRIEIRPKPEGGEP